MHKHYAFHAYSLGQNLILIWEELMLSIYPRKDCMGTVVMCLNARMVTVFFRSVEPIFSTVG